MDKILAPLESQLIQQDAQYLEVVVLLVADNVNHLVNGEVLESELCGADVLGHVNRSAVAAQKQFLVQSFGSEVCPYRAVFTTIEKSFFKSFFHLFPAFEIGFAFVVDFVKSNAQGLVCFIETGINPVVHALPEAAHFGVVLLPFYQHVMCFLDEGSLLLGGFFVHAFFHQFLYLLAVVLVKGHIIVSNQVVALLAAAFGCFAVAVVLPCQHALADVDSAVVNDVGLDNLVSVGLHDVGQSPS